MGAALRAVPLLYWVAAAWTGLAFWSGDVRGIYLAILFLLLGSVQVFRSAE